MNRRDLLQMLAAAAVAPLIHVPKSLDRFRWQARPVRIDGVYWTSSDTTVVTVDPRTGWVTAVGLGSATITEVRPLSDRVVCHMAVVRDPTGSTTPRQAPVGQWRIF